ncbi:MAG TPA: enoyl-CoA hydratase-related protein [Conexibacter sp.]|jgi:enoyl-CoA hydratase
MTTDSFGDLRLERPAEGVARLVLNRPDRLNALTWNTVDEVLRALDAVAHDHDVRVLVLTGAGRGFCAGLDIKQRDDAMGTGDDVFTVYRRQELIGRLALDMRGIPQPVIAAVNGPAAGGGLGLALAADIRLCAPEASFVVSFVRVGLSGADAGVSHLLPRIVGLGMASELMLTGRPVGAEEALRIGLANRVVEAGELDAAALELAGRIAANSPFGVWMTKQVLQRNVDAPSLEAAVELENRTQVLATRTQDADEAMAAFRDGRAARFASR